MKAKTITLRVDQGTADRIKRLRLAGAHKAYMNSAFARMIFNIGLNKYEKNILPIETDEGYHTSPMGTQRTEPKVITFPGVTLQNQQGDLQDEIEGFLREMGYIK